LGNVIPMSRSFHKILGLVLSIWWNIYEPVTIAHGGLLH
jgi:hypothetical protein